MCDCGVLLYNLFKKEFNAEVFIQALEDYTAVQIKTI